MDKLFSVDTWFSHDTPALWFIHLFAAFFFLYQPFAGLKEKRRRNALPPEQQAAARLKFYRRFCLGALVISSLTGLYWMMLPMHVFLLPVHFSFLPGQVSGEVPLFGVPARTFQYLGIELLGAIAGGMALRMVLLRGKHRISQYLRKHMASYAYLYPSTAQQRRWWLLLSLCAGVSEELIYRGFLTDYLLSTFCVNIVAALWIGAALFGFAHLYQGFRGVLVTGCVGAVLGILYLGTGHLWIPMLLHTLFNMRILISLWAVGGQIPEPQKTAPTSA